MLIKTMVIEGKGGDVEVARTDKGALITCGDRVLCEVLRDEDYEPRYRKVYEVARVVYGERRNWGARGSGRAMIPAATRSMIHDLLDEMDRVAGC